MSLRQHETDRWVKDRWFRKLNSLEKLLFSWMCDACDCAGFLEWDVEQACDETGMDAERVSKGFKGLCKGFEGFERVRKGFDKTRGEREVVWIVNRVKVQIQSTTLNMKVRFHAGIARRFDEREAVFGDVWKVYAKGSKGLERVSNGSEPLERGTNNNNNNNNKLKSLVPGESEGGAGDAAEDSEYESELVRLRAAGCPITRAGFRKCITSHPKADLAEVVEHACLASESMTGNMGSAFEWLKRRFSYDEVGRLRAEGRGEGTERPRYVTSSGPPYKAGELTENGKLVTHQNVAELNEQAARKT